LLPRAHISISTGSLVVREHTFAIGQVAIFIGADLLIVATLKGSTGTISPLAGISNCAEVSILTGEVHRDVYAALTQFT